ncbi:MAG: hypothetical protein WCG55_01325 [bacterium]
MEYNKKLLIAFYFLCGAALDVAACYQTPKDGLVLSFIALLCVTAAIWKFSPENSIWSFAPVVFDLLMMGSIFSIGPVSVKYSEIALLVSIALPITLLIAEVSMNIYIENASS